MKKLKELTDEEFLAKKDQIMRLLNSINDPESWYEGYCEGWAKKMSLHHQIIRIIEGPEALSFKDSLD